MMNDNERQYYINCTYIFLDSFCNYKACPRQVLNTLKIASYKYIKDPAVIGFAVKLRPIINSLFNHPDLINAFMIDNKYPQYRLQKIAEAYNKTLAPFATIFNEAFFNNHNGRACNIHDVLDFLNATNNGIDETFINAFCNYYDNLSVTEANNFCNRYFQYYPLNIEIQEFLKANAKQACGPRFEEFKEIKTVGFNYNNVDINYVDFNREYASKVIGNIGEYLYADRINNLDKFIHSAKDVGDHLGYDMYFYNTAEQKEDLIEVKATEKKSYYGNKDFFSLGSTERLMLGRFLKEKSFNYSVRRVFINFDDKNIKYYHIVKLNPQSDEVFIDEDGNLYKIGIDDFGNEAYICDGIVRKNKLVRN